MSSSVKNYFPGCNTSEGFYSLYKFIISQKDARRIICIKGGPGTGKSSLMKKIGKYFSDKNFDIELHHCSSDNNSLDGVLIRGLNVAVIDGTSPHIVDPVNPGAVDEVLNMGDCWREEGFTKYRKNIIDTNHEIGDTFKRCYKFLSAARPIYEDLSYCNYESLNLFEVNKVKEYIKDKYFNSNVTSRGRGRHLFATAFTPNGIVTYIENLLEGYENVYVLKGGPGRGKSNILEYISEEALNRGYYTEIFHHPFIPNKLEHILIPDLSLAVVTSNEINQLQISGHQFNMEDMVLEDKNLNSNKTEEDKEVFYDLINRALNVLKGAKELHDKLETYYIGNMDFDKVNEKTNYVIDKIEGYAKDYIADK